MVNIPPSAAAAAAAAYSAAAASTYAAALPPLPPLSVTALPEVSPPTQANSNHKRKAAKQLNPTTAATADANTNPTSTDSSSKKSKTRSQPAYLKMDHLFSELREMWLAGEKNKEAASAATLQIKTAELLEGIAGRFTSDKYFKEVKKLALNCLCFPQANFSKTILAKVVQRYYYDFQASLKNFICSSTHAKNEEAALPSMTIAMELMANNNTFITGITDASKYDYDLVACYSNRFIDQVQEIFDACISRGWSKVVQLLVSKGVPDFKGSALSLAVQGGNKEIVDCVRTCSDPTRSLFYFAAQIATEERVNILYFKTLDQLIDLGAKFSYRGSYLHTAIYHKTCFPSVEMIDWALQRSNPSVINVHSWIKFYYHTSYHINQKAKDLFLQLTPDQQKEMAHEMCIFAEPSMTKQHVHHLVYHYANPKTLEENLKLNPLFMSSDHLKELIEAIHDASKIFERAFRRKKEEFANKMPNIIPTMPKVLARLISDYFPPEQFPLYQTCIQIEEEMQPDVQAR